jgi:hypothetical protein
MFGAMLVVAQPIAPMNFIQNISAPRGAKTIASVVGVGAIALYSGKLGLSWLFGNTLEKIERKLAYTPRFTEKNFLSTSEGCLKLYKWRAEDSYHDGVVFATSQDIKQSAKAVAKRLLGDAYLPGRICLPSTSRVYDEDEEMPSSVKVSDMYINRECIIEIAREIEKEFIELRADLDLCRKTVKKVRLFQQLRQAVQQTLNKNIVSIMNLEDCSQQQLQQLHDHLRAVLVDKKASERELKALRIFFMILPYYFRLYQIRNVCKSEFLWIQSVDANRQVVVL